MTVTETAIQRLLDALQRHECNPRQGGPDKWTARCPSHPDDRPSLSVSQGPDKVLVHCHAGCPNNAVVGALKLDMADLFDRPRTNGAGRDIVATYDYVDGAGKLLFQVVRKAGKKFLQRRLDPRHPDADQDGWVWKLGHTRRVLYRLPEVLAAVEAGHVVFVVEGEKDADRVAADGSSATCNPHGAGPGKWKPEFTATLRGALVVIVADHDESGLAHARHVAGQLEGVAASVRIVQAATGKDVFDHLAAGHTLDGLVDVPPDQHSGGEPGPADPGPDVEPQGLRVPAATKEFGTDVPDGHRLTDVGNAARLAALADGRIRHVHAWGRWIVYRDGVWSIDAGDALITETAKQVPRHLFKLATRIHGDKDLRERVWKWAVRSETSGAIAAMVRLARGIPGIIVDHHELDQHPWLLNTFNATIDLRTGKRLDHDPEHLLTVQAPVVYDPAARAPLWEECLATWQPDEATRSYLQRAVGSGATGHPLEHLFLNFGHGSNGKGKFYGAIKHTLGPYVRIPDKSLFVIGRHDPHPTVKADLFGARLLLAPETEHGDRLAEAAVKELTGGDTISARRMREDPWDFRPTWTAFLHTNHKPTIRGTDEGVWRRIRLIPWEVVIPNAERDLRLAAKLQVEAAGILNWIVAGARAFHDNGLDEPAVVTEATAAYRQGEDHLGRFIVECCTLGQGHYVMADKLRARYEQWCEAEGEDPLGTKTVGAQLRDRGVEKPTSGRPRWLGIGLRAEDPTEDS